MRHPVVVEVRGGSESLAADLALMGLFAAVNPSMGVEGAARAESFVAYHADMRLLPWTKGKTYRSSPTYR